VVVISDPSALSMRNATAGIGPIHWAWRASGATTVIMRRWSGNDARSNEIVEEFYKQLAAGRPATVALAAAQARVRTVEDGRAPAAWAGWLVLDGK
jgi:CHAT domain-containing protein